MKKLIILAAVIAIFAIGANADDVAMGKGMTAKGVKFGVNLTKLTGDGVDMIIDELTAYGANAENKMWLAFGGGVFFEYSFSPQFAVQPEFLFMMKGTKFDATVGTVTESAKLKFTYIEVPILMKFKIPTEGNFKPNIFAGPAVDLLLSAKAANGGSIDIKPAFKDIDFGVAFGAGFMYALEKGGITFDARYTLGLTDIPDTGGLGSISMKHTNISFMLGYAF